MKYLVLIHGKIAVGLGGSGILMTVILQRSSYLTVGMHGYSKKCNRLQLKKGILMSIKIANPGISCSISSHSFLSTDISDMLNLCAREATTSHNSAQPSLPQSTPAPSILAPAPSIEHPLASQPDTRTSEESSYTCKACKKEFAYRADNEAHQILGCQLCERCDLKI